MLGEPVSRHAGHLLPEVSALCTRIGVLDTGRLVLQNQLAGLEQPTGRVLISTEDPERAVAALDGLVECREGADLADHRADLRAAVVHVPEPRHDAPGGIADHGDWSRPGADRPVHRAQARMLP